MIDNTRALELIEDAQQNTRICGICGQPAVPVARSGGVWLVCASLVQQKGLMRRLVTLDMATGHTNRLIFETSAVEAAA
jgi:hypothetical protein